MNTRFDFFLFLAIILFIYSCGKDDSPSGTSVNGDVDYFFEVEFAGKIHKIQGNTSSVIPWGGTSGSGNVEFANRCLATTGQDWTVGLGIEDKSSSNYVSGDNFYIGLTINNASVGNNTGRIIFSGFDNYFESLNVERYLRFYENLSSPSNLNEISNINITDLGTQTTMNQFSECGLITERFYCFGNTLKGSYDGTLKFMHNDQIWTNEPYSVSVPIKIRFSVTRVN